MPSVVSAVKSGASSPSRSVIVVPRWSFSGGLRAGGYRVPRQSRVKRSEIGEVASEPWCCSRVGRRTRRSARHVLLRVDSAAGSRSDGDRMAGYSGTPLPKKLGIKDGRARRVVRGAATASNASSRRCPPESSCAPTRVASSTSSCSSRHASASSRAGSRSWPARCSPAGGLWVAWPKKTSCVATDLTFDPVQQIGLDAGLVDNKVCAIDDTWSALRFVGPRRRPPGRVAERCVADSCRPARRRCSPSTSTSTRWSLDDPTGAELQRRARGRRS